MTRFERWLVFKTLSKKLLPWFVGVSLYCMIIGMLVDREQWHADWGAEAAVVNGVILGVLMGLRNRAAYDRWWEARRLWGQLVNDSRNLAWKVQSYVPSGEIAAAKFPQLLAGFADALKGHLRKGIRLQDVAGFEQAADQPKHVPSYLAGRIIGCIAGWQQDEVVDPRTMQIMDTHSRSLLDVCGGCERILNTPISLSYRALLRFGIALNILAAPWFIVLELGGNWSIPVVIVVCFFLVGVEIVDTEVEEPFGEDLNDLPLSSYCRTIRQSTEEIFSTKLPRSAVASSDSMPV
jgi:ion channel-forming bestrophin family protein